MAADNESYWVDRHERLRSKLAAVGDITGSEERNLELYAEKKRQLVDMLRAIDADDLTGKSVLDAGCGVGVMSELLYVLGAEVHGVDASPVAVEEASHRCPTGVFAVSSLVDFDLGSEFELTFCLDVLYHVIDDANWRQVLSRLVSHTCLGGRVVIIDQHKPEPTSPADHVQFRTRAMYDAELASLGATPVPLGGHGTFLVYETAA